MFTLFGYTLALAPAQLAALALAAIGLLAAAHLVGRRPRRMLVSTIDPWSLPRGPARRSRLGWRIQRWLTFLLHAAIALLLVLALADPRPGGGQAGGRAIALLLDRSASMAARAGAGTRIDEAREQARAIAARLEPGDRVLVAGFARQLEVETTWTADAAAIEAAIARIEVGTQADDLPAAVTAVTALVTGRDRPRIVAIGDRRAPAAPVEYVAVGEPVDNVGIVGLTLQRTDEEPRAEAFLTVQASARTGGKARIDLVSLPGGRRVQSAVVDLPARGTRTVRLSFAAAGATRLAAVLVEPAPGPGNALLADDRAVALLPPVARRRVLLVSDGNLYLEGALRSFGPGLLLDQRPASGPPVGKQEASSYDAVVFDGVAPLPPPAAGRYLYLDPSGPGSPFPVRGLLRDPIPTELARNHPLLRHVTLADLNIREARRLSASPGDVVVAAALGVPLILARERPGLRIVALGFDLRRSDLPMRPTLPLLLANALDWLAAVPGQPTGEPGGVPLDPAEVDTRDAAAGTAPAPPAPPRLASTLPAVHLFLLVALALALAEWWAHRRRWTS